MGLICDLDSPSLVLTPRRQRSRKPCSQSAPAEHAPPQFPLTQRAPSTPSSEDFIDIRPYLKHCCTYSEQDSRIVAETPILPHVVAATALNEVCTFLETDLPSEWILQLASRAETVYRHDPKFRRLLRRRGNSGRDTLYAFTRHWIASLLNRNYPGLYAQLPASYSVGHPLPVSNGFFFFVPQP